MCDLSGGGEMRVVTPETEIKNRPPYKINMLSAVLKCIYFFYILLYK